MRTALIALLTFAMTSSQPSFPLQQESGGGYFDEFYAKFKTAVANLDKQRLERMMAQTLNS